jgi:hypothetical protein
MYQQHGSPDSGALCLEKAAKMIEQQHPDKAIELYRRGVDVVLVSHFCFKNNIKNVEHEMRVQCI